MRPTKRGEEELIPFGRRRSRRPPAPAQGLARANFEITKYCPVGGNGADWTSSSYGRLQHVSQIGTQTSHQMLSVFGEDSVAEHQAKWGVFCKFQCLLG